MTYCSLKYTVEHQVNYNVCTPDVEIQCLTLKLPHTRPTHILNVYRAPNGDLSKALEALSNLLLHMNGLGTPDILVLGDINVDLIKPSTNKNKITQFTVSNNLTQLIKTQTRCTNTGATLVDHIYTNNNIFFNIAGVYDPGLSDHSMVYVTRKSHKPKQNGPERD